MDNITVFCCDGRLNREEVNLSLKATILSCDKMKSNGVFCSPFDINRKINSIQIKELNSVAEYSSWMLYEPYRYIATEFALFVQADGFVLNEKEFMPEFLEYDYIGAPWPANWPISEYSRVGNGGFSLRSRKFLKAVRDLNHKVEEDYPAEDAIICAVLKPDLERQGLKFAPVELAARFSFESFTEFSHENTFGFHGRNNPITKEYCKLI